MRARSRLKRYCVQLNQYHSFLSLECRNPCANYETIMGGCAVDFVFFVHSITFVFDKLGQQTVGV
jgi:hypothetical protein